MGTLRQAAIADYHELLQRPETLMRTREELCEKLNSAELNFKDRLISPYLRPYFVERENFDKIKNVCHQMWTAFQRIGTLALEDRHLQDYLGLNEAERKLIVNDPMRGEVSPLSRLDSFLSDSYKFVELNAETPAGIAYSDIASDIYYNLEVMKEFRKKYRVSKLKGMDNLTEVLLSEYANFSGKGTKPQIAIVDYAGTPTIREFELIKDHLNKKGFATIIADPRDLEFTGGHLHKGDFRIDLVYKRLLISDVMGRMDDCKTLLEAYESNAVCMVNCFRGSILHKKALFGILTDEQFANKFSREELELIEKHVPWTRRVEERETRFKGKPTDLISLIKNNKEDLVLKPNDGYGGKGIYIGWQASQNEWEDAIGLALNSDYLVQEKVPTSHEVFPCMTDDGGVLFTKLLVDLDPFLYKGVVGDAVTRLSHTELSNVSSGGGMVPVFVIESIEEG